MGGPPEGRGHLRSAPRGAGPSVVSAPVVRVWPGWFRAENLLQQRPGRRPRGRAGARPQAGGIGLRQPQSLVPSDLPEGGLAPQPPQCPAPREHRGAPGAAPVWGRGGGHPPPGACSPGSISQVWRNGLKAHVPQGRVPARSRSLGLRSPRQLGDPRGRPGFRPLCPIIKDACARGQRAGTRHSPRIPRHRGTKGDWPLSAATRPAPGSHAGGHRARGAQTVPKAAGSRGQGGAARVVAAPLTRPPGTLLPGGSSKRGAGCTAGRRGPGARAGQGTTPPSTPAVTRPREEAWASERGAGGREACPPRGGQEAGGQEGRACVTSDDPPGDRRRWDRPS